MLRNRAADNWRVLLAIADNLGHGEAARCAATKLASNRLDEDPGVVLLGDIRNLFQAWRVDRIASATLVEALLALDDSFWNEWRGPNDDRPPRKLTQGELARMLRPFEIWPRTIWSTQRRRGDNSRRGYLRSQFETAWRAYCPSADTPTHRHRQAKSGICRDRDPTQHAPLIIEVRTSITSVSSYPRALPLFWPLVQASESLDSIAPEAFRRRLESAAS